VVQELCIYILVAVEKNDPVACRKYYGGSTAEESLTTIQHTINILSMYYQVAPLTAPLQERCRERDQPDYRKGT